MAKVFFKEDQISIEVDDGTKLVEAVRSAGLSIETPCNGMGTCGKCKVKAVGELSPITDKEKGFIRESLNERLACATMVLGDVEVELISKEAEIKTIGGGDSIDVKLDGDIKLVKLPPVDKTSSKPYIESLEYKVSFSALDKIAEIEKRSPDGISGVAYRGKLLDIGESIDKLYGVAMDIGTTGMSTYLVDINTGEILNKKSGLNPQSEYGGDVLSRIAYGMNNPDGKENLKKAVVGKINGMIGSLLEASSDCDCVYRVVVAANTVMLHMLLGVDSETIAKAPYRPVFLNSMDIKASDLGIRINREGIVTLLPSASGYVGADIIAGATATGFDKKEKNSVYIDIGTNGEILAVSNGRLMATSTAAGPAFEGMNISCGCRAEAGAIDAFVIEDGELKFSTIGDEKPIGICGSGLIDIAFELIRNKVILRTGRLNGKLEGKLAWRIRDKKFYITDEVYLSQADIRQIQLAKGAISAGVIMLLKEMNMSIEEVEEVVIAGSFGYHLNPESILGTGIIPRGFKGKMTFAGNSSVEGARLALINKDLMSEMTGLKSQIEVLELSMKAEFQDCFVREMSF